MRIYSAQCIANANLKIISSPILVICIDTKEYKKQE